MRFSTTSFLSLVALAATTRSASAFSNGAGGCAPGQAAVAGLHVANPGFVTGSLADGGITVTFDGEDSSAALLSSEGTDVEVSSESGFRGVLIMSVDPAVGIVPVDGVQPAGACAAIGATGVTHFDPSLKEEVEAVVDCQAPTGSQVLLGVTVVVSNNQNDGSEFYYSEYLVTCGEAATGVPTAVVDGNSTASNVTTTPPTDTST
ncbi:MAG: hypothetical protein SGARI_005005, partial [Bacillariaceae sp.]